MTNKNNNIKKRSIKNILLRALIAFFAIVLISIFIIMLIYKVELNKNKDSNKKVVPLLNAYIIVSPSMEPNIKVQDAVIVRKVDPKNLKKGDIITFASDNNKYAGLTITHRIVSIKKVNNKLLFETKGDNNNVIDEGYITENDILGKVVFKIPKLGYIQIFLSNAYGWILLILVPCIIIIIFDAVKLYQMAKKNLIKNNSDDLTIIDPYFMIEKENNKIYYYDLKSAVLAANNDINDTIINILVDRYDLFDIVEINKNNSKLILKGNATIIKQENSDIIIRSGELILDGVVIEEK